MSSFITYRPISLGGGGGGSGSGVNTLLPVGSSPNANAGVISGVTLTLEPANASFPGVLLAADWTTFNNKQNALGFTPENSANKGIANGYASLDASALVPITQIPPAALERLVIVADQTARFALTTATVQNGDTVKQTDINEMFFVIDDTNLGNSAGYAVYSAGTAASVAWSGITGIPAPVSALLGTNTGDVTLGTASGLSIVGQVLSLALSSTSTTGSLSNTDWNTFNGKQAAGNYITALTGDVTAAGPGSVAATVASVGGSTAANINTATALVNGSQTGNVVFASPSGGGAGAPAFRALVSADIPNLNATKITAGTLNAARGGTNADSSGSTGLAKVAAGTWSFATLVNADVSGSAAIAYSKLNLSASIVNADISTSAAIAVSKIASVSPTVQTLTSGTTYTTPAGVKYIKIRAVAAGGGGGGSGTAGGGTGASGGTTSFGTAGSVFSLAGGAGGVWADNGGNGGAVTTGTGTTIVSVNGAKGSSSGNVGLSTGFVGGGAGAATAFGAGGSGSLNSAGGTSGAYGCGGGGAGSQSQSNNYGGSGGASGAYIEVFVSGPSASYTYAIGAAGAGGGAGTNGFAGGDGRQGVIIVEEYYI